MPRFDSAPLGFGSGLTGCRLLRESGLATGVLLLCLAVDFGSGVICAGSTPVACAIRF
ncbi:hypothetical protein ACIRRI_48190 [Streptomyces mirabilis]|uniref:hypothetical protein n=1 Tax=Streptomyces mirabilis TaxID=68239 RepID=UPI00380837AA